jgi:hypothetical protein
MHLDTTQRLRACLTVHLIISVVWDLGVKRGKKRDRPKPLINAIICTKKGKERNETNLNNESTSPGPKRQGR